MTKEKVSDIINSAKGLLSVAGSTWKTILAWGLFLWAGFSCYKLFIESKSGCSGKAELVIIWENLFKQKDKDYQELVIAFANIREMSKKETVIPSSFLLEENVFEFASFKVDTVKKPLTKEQKILKYADSVLEVQRKKDSLLRTKIPAKQ